MVLVLSETAEFVYKTTNYYAPGYEGSIIWNDKILSIDWPELTLEYIFPIKI